MRDKVWVFSDKESGKVLARFPFVGNLNAKKAFERAVTDTDNSLVKEDWPKIEARLLADN